MMIVVTATAQQSHAHVDSSHLINLNNMKKQDYIINTAAAAATQTQPRTS